MLWKTSCLAGSGDKCTLEDAPCAEASLDITHDLQEVLNMIQNQGEFEMEAILDMAIAAALDDCVLGKSGSDSSRRRHVRSRWP